ncbi:MAG TPA: hypothetical protein VKI64_08660 [Acidimicrobiales bacterium]|nr:hypothetical protein [Acidimicrobiales bacterium]
MDLEGGLVALAEVIDEHVLQRYRELLDAEDAAFDELEHAFEDGDRDRFDADLAAWRQAVQRRLVFLPRLGVEVPAPVRA